MPFGWKTDIKRLGAGEGSCAGDLDRRRQETQLGLRSEPSRFARDRGAKADPIGAGTHGRLEILIDAGLARESSDGCPVDADSRSFRSFRPFTLSLLQLPFAAFSEPAF